jgi:hypothetical protein
MHGWRLAARASLCAIQRRLIRYNPTFVGEAAAYLVCEINAFVTVLVYEAVAAAAD